MANAKAKKSKKVKGPKDSKAYKVMSNLTTGVATKAATKGLDAGWSAATGAKPPKSKKLASPEIAGREAVLWTLLSTGGVAVAKLLAERATARYYQHSTGELPPQLLDKPAKAKKKK
ncbi:hypothetical protein Back2_02510 [Nocardioides baekrokdamisoli]|uniref:DUF4235 domain-containing protein n=1 Tax=Nocardioides baekrokdamisoli TaxID=1804624 RepID=A0A3G9IXR1_9ACTN|nr:DUF4235 domain-containing protein [Nocardioides baekrokdamisoli]BBH15964.1 hypothetical protein Back2_02510 [Nocardioides baekrokdamisoli]